VCEALNLCLPGNLSLREERGSNDFKLAVGANFSRSVLTLPPPEGPHKPSTRASAGGAEAGARRRPAGGIVSFVQLADIHMDPDYAEVQPVCLLIKLSINPISAV